MYRILLIDDERNVVNHISSLLENSTLYPFNIYKAYCANDALEILKHSKIDIAVIDINMPGMNGLELSERIQNCWKKTKIIFLTAHDEFEYIYRATSTKTEKFILKIETDELILEEIYDVVEDIKKENNSEFELEQLHSKEVLIDYFLNQLILKNFIFNKVNLSEIINQKFPLQMNRPVHIINISLNFNDDEQYKLFLYNHSLSVLTIIKHYFAEKFFYAILEEGNSLISLFLQSKTEDLDINVLKQVCDDFLNACYSAYQNNPVIVINPEKISWEKIESSLKDINEFSYLEVKETQYKGYVVEYNKEKYSSYNKEYLNANKNQNFEKSYQNLKRFLYSCDKYNYDIELKLLKDICVNKKDMTNLIAIKIYINIAIILLDFIENNSYEDYLINKISTRHLHDFNEFSNWNEAFDYLKNLSILIFDIKRNNEIDRNTLIVEKIYEYINVNISGDLSLAKISSYVSYNDSYVSRLFKKITGNSLSDYISLARIERAKFLLKNSQDSIQQIAYATGFDTSQYFSNVFKRKTGISPSDYRGNVIV
ncbi:MAG: response regulator [Clostridia bacterium]